MKAHYIQAIDGDTYEFSVNPYPKMHIRDKFRLFGYDTPELKGKCEKERKLAIAAKEFAQGMLSHSRWTTVEIHEIGKYGRPVATVMVYNQDLGKALESKGLAQEWHGKDAKPSWCDEA